MKMINEVTKKLVECKEKGIRVDTLSGFSTLEIKENELFINLGVDEEELECDLLEAYNQLVNALEKLRFVKEVINDHVVKR